MRAVWMVAALGCAWLASGCDEPVQGDGPNQLLLNCCNEARDRVALAKDMETELFDRRCEACRQGKGQRACAQGAQKVHRTVQAAYRDQMLPVSCNALKGLLKKQGIAVGD